MHWNSHIATEGTNNFLRIRTYETGSMKRVLIYLLGGVIVVAAIFVCLFFRPGIGAQVFWSGSLTGKD